MLTSWGREDQWDVGQQPPPSSRPAPPGGKPSETPSQRSQGQGSVERLCMNLLKTQSPNTWAHAQMHACLCARTHTHIRTHTRVPCGTGLLCRVSSSSRGSWLGPQGTSSEREGSMVLELAPSRQGAGGRLGAGPRSRRRPQCSVLPLSMGQSTRV